MFGHVRRAAEKIVFVKEGDKYRFGWFSSLLKDMGERSLDKSKAIVDVNA